jgi:cell wall-associated NlpC family hydrolase
LANVAQGATMEPTSTRGRSIGRSFRLSLLAGLLALTAIAVEAPAATQASSGSEAQRVVRLARSHIGARFRLGTEGPRSFDCSGLIFRVYKQAGLINRVGGHRRLAAGYYYYFKRKGLASRHNGRVGDLVIWTHKGRITHSGIYIGHGQVISALINPWGVKRTSLHGVRSHFLAFLHVRLAR